jgi:hypothetical protein
MTIKFGRGKDRQKRKQRRKEFYGPIREQARKDARKGEAGWRQQQSLDASIRGNAAYAAGRADVALDKTKKQYSKMKETLTEKGTAALGKAKDFLGKAKGAASQLTGKAKSAVSSGYSAVKEKAQDLLRKRKGGSAESYARAIEALEFEVAKQVGILEFASGRNYIEFAGWNPFQKKEKRGQYRNVGAGQGGKNVEVASSGTYGAAKRATTGAYDRVGGTAGQYDRGGRVAGGALAKRGPSSGGSLVGKAKQKVAGGLGRRGKIAAALGTGAAVGGAMALGYKKGRGRDKQKRRRRIG